MKTEQMTGPNPETRPESFTLLIGPPRSGTTLIANTFMSHSSVCGILEPYQQGRVERYETTTLPDFHSDHDLDCETTPHLAVKETTTRLRNVELSLALAQDAQARGIYTAIIVILRCPIEAFLSQVDAARAHWSENKLPHVTEDSVIEYFDRVRAGLKRVCMNARRFHVRIVTYDAFCTSPEQQTARLMALVPVPLEQHQLRFTPDATIIGEADPKFTSKRGTITKSDRTLDVDAFIATYQNLPSVKFALELRTLIAVDEIEITTVEKLNALTALVL